MTSLLLFLVVLLTLPQALVAQTDESCSGSLPTRLSSGQQATVVSSGPLSLRQRPDRGSELTRIPEGSLVLLLDGPSCGPIRQFTWWYVQYGETFAGWIAEGNALEYWLQPAAEATEEPRLLNPRGELLVNREVEGALEPFTTDVWTFEAEQGEIYIFSAPLVDSPPALQFFSSSGKLVDAGEMVGWITDISVQLMLVALETDQYSVQVSAYDAEFELRYRLQWERLPLQEDHILKFNTPVAGELLGENTLENFEVWALDGLQGAIAVLTTTVSESDLYGAPSMLLMDAQGQPLTYGEESISGNQNKLGFMMDDQRYYLIVRWFPSEVRDYELIMTLGKEEDLGGTSFSEFNMGMACPFVYIRQDGEWVYDTTILYGLVGADAKGIQAQTLTAFDGHLLIREVEPETSYIDMLYVLVTDAYGREHRLNALNPALASSDNVNLVLEQGDAVELEFADFSGIESPVTAVIVAEGYYVPHGSGR